MKEDVLEQIVEDHLQLAGYFNDAQHQMSPAN